jgi:NADPH:quinone reductase-like Zn-dependent oxidoreductase
MKAVAIHAFGGPEVLKVEDVPRPEPKEDEVLIRVIAASVNPVDAAIRKGYLARITGKKFPLILGMDAAGVVEKAGAKMSKFKAGDPVYAFFTLASEGGYGEFVLAKPDEVAPKPKTLTYAEAAAVPAAGSTAWKALVETANLSAGQTVLIHGGSGGVGHFAIQIAKARGAKVIATASTANQDFLRQMGADVAIDYTKSKFEDIAKDVDVVLDAVGEDTLKRSYGVVKKGGIIVSIVDDPDKAALDAQSLSAALRANGENVHAGLARYQRQQLSFGSAVVALSREEGAYLSAQLKGEELHRDFKDVVNTHNARNVKIQRLVANRNASVL